MVNATDVKAGMALHIDGKLYKVLEAIRHTGSGQMHGFIELKLKDIRYHHFADRRFKHTDRLEEVELTRRPMDFLYTDAEGCWFMDPDTYEQVSLPKTAIGTTLSYMKEGMRITVELLGTEAVAVQFPKVVELKVASTGPAFVGVRTIR
jgi:elongation factor P